MKFDNLDNRLINTLINNSRDSFRGLGEELDVAPSTVSGRINELEKKGVINGYTTTVDYNKLGYKFTVIIHLKVDGVVSAEFIDRLRDQKRMICVYEITGDYDIIAVGKFKDTEEMNAQIKDLRGEVNIQETNTSIVLNKINENEQFKIDVDKG